MNTTLYLWKHAARKLCTTLRTTATLAAARTLGHYENSVWNGEFHYARYRWRGKVWAFPTPPFEEGAP